MYQSNIPERIAKLGPWFQNLHLPDGSQTAPDHALGDFPRHKWQEIAPHLPLDLTGRKALDIGCNAGFYSFELARRGAEVMALDIDAHCLEQARWAARIFNLDEHVRFRQLPIYDLAESNEQYDIVWFMGLIDHLRYPLLALDLVRRCCRGQMVFQSITIPGDSVLPIKEDYALDEREILMQPGWPQMAFIEHRFAGDLTTWWALNHAGVEALLRAAGFGNIQRIAPEVYLCEAVPLPESAHELYAVTKHRI